MTNDTRFNQATLDALQEANKTAYAQRVSKHDFDMTKPANARGNYPRVFMHGAIVEVNGKSLSEFLTNYEALRAEGYSRSAVTEYAVGIALFGFMAKPAELQAEELVKENARIEDDYRAAVEANAQKAAEKEAEEELAAIEAEVQATLAREQGDRIAAIRARILGEKAATAKRASK
ncbi:hypothetical protein ATI02_5976 [Pseudomonas baetica]|uniref:Uncharacterized protein n=1 Tax=Pseudomonas baetica TaxID=674054 RepID=A0ABX4Q7T4_9PSED|nr:hypothetical protein [Pseudomonas baetica]PKA72875.1 hypothetical protein ATI02_5976 [Pseudomonas baetica]PTC19027.1 hypothetical protein C0J26_11340 [Pseudomonas baetica]